MNPEHLPTDPAAPPKAPSARRPRFLFSLLFSVWLTVLTLATLITFIVPEQYRSTARIRIGPDRPDIPGMETTAVPHPTYDPYFIQTELEVLQSQEVLDRVINDLKLRENWGKKLGYDRPLTPFEALKYLRSKIDARPVRNTSLIELDAYDVNPQEAAKLANALAERYREHRLEHRVMLLKGGMEALDAQWREHEAKINEAQQRIDQLRLLLRVVEIPSSEKETPVLTPAETLRQVESRRIEASAEYIRQQALLTRLKELKFEELIAALPSLVPDPVFESLSAQLNQAGTRLEAAAPAEQEALRSQVQDLRARVRERAKGILAGAELKAASLKQNHDELQRECDRAVQTSLEQATKARPYFEATRQLEEMLRFRQLLYLKIASAQTEQKLPCYSMTEIVDRAIPGMRPVRPNKPLNIFSGIILGGGLGLFLASLVYFLELIAIRRQAATGREPFPRRFRLAGQTGIALAGAFVTGWIVAVSHYPFEAILIIMPLLLTVSALIFVGSVTRPADLPSPTSTTGSSERAIPDV